MKTKTIQDLIDELSLLPNKERLVTIVVGDEDDNTIDTEQFEIHHAADDEHPIELFVFDDCF